MWIRTLKFVIVSSFEFRNSNFEFLLSYRCAILYDAVDQVG